MNRHFKTAVAIALGLGTGTVVLADNSATQDVDYQVQAINEITVSGTPSLTISTATAGSQPDDATGNATYDITTNESNKKITAAINTDMPANTTLKVNMAAPTGATGGGTLELSTTAVDAVTGISTVAESGLGITYTLSATVAAGVLSSATKTVTFTILAGS